MRGGGENDKRFFWSLNSGPGPGLGWNRDWDWDRDWD